MRAIGYDGLVKRLVRLDVKAKQESALQVQAAAEQLQEEVARLKAEAAEAGWCRHVSAWLLQLANAWCVQRKHARCRH